MTLNIGRSLDLKDIPISGAYLKIAAAAGITANLQVTCPLVLFPVRDIILRMTKSSQTNNDGGSSYGSSQLIISIVIISVSLTLALLFEYHFAAVCGLIGSICTTVNSVLFPVLFYHSIHKRESIPTSRFWLHGIVVAIALSAAIAGVWSDFCSIFREYC